MGSEKSSTFFSVGSILDPKFRVGQMRNIMNNQVSDISGNPMQRTNFTLAVDTEAYFGCSVVYNGETLILGGKKEPNQVFSH